MTDATDLTRVIHKRHPSVKWVEGDLKIRTSSDIGEGVILSSQDV